MVGAPGHPRPACPGVSLSVSFPITVPLLFAGGGTAGSWVYSLRTAPAGPGVFGKVILARAQGREQSPARGFGSRQQDLFAEGSSLSEQSFLLPLGSSSPAPRFPEDEMAAAQPVALSRGSFPLLALPLQERDAGLRGHIQPPAPQPTSGWHLSQGPFGVRPGVS